MGLDYKFGRGVSDDKASWFVLLSLKKMIKLTWEQMAIGNEAESRLVCEDSECTLFEGVTSISI